ncbi:hypothetical protein HPP92_012417 [Vanilla planifolia]|uniref:Pentatricopeptide repeat-containing protein n=1 Tax=Vanilla planifolia TaxID=51239 RepID=A0A835UXR5_VANPL|nr:hypothetical protein HPP92_012417 [Vanilla planifolia]
MLKKLFFLPSEFSKLLHFSIIPLLGSSSLILNRCRSVYSTHAYPSLNLLRSITSNTLFASEETAYRLRFLLNRRLYCSNPAEVRPKRGLGIGSSVISRCSHLWEKKPEIFPENYSSLQEILKQYGDLGPEVIRRFWRVSVLQPGDFLEILIGFSQRNDSKLVVEFLWLMFRWASKQARDFHHLPRSYEMMISLLIKSHVLSDAECLLLSSQSRGVFFSPGRICSEIIQGYAESSLLENAVALYDKARHQGLQLSSSCYGALLNLTIEMDKSDLAVRVYIEMVESEFGLCDDGRFLKYVVGFLSKNERTLEAVNILRLVRNSGLKASPETLDAVFQGYCCKKDYVDALNFLKEWLHIPPSFICNKIVSSICKSLGSEYAWFFGRELESLGFQLDDITFGILIVQSCKERKLRDGLVYLSESFSRGIKLKFYAYNSLLGGFLKEGLHKCAKDIFEEILEKGILLDLSTFKTLLAGYFKYRKFDEIDRVLIEMANYGFISLTPGVDPVSVALRFLDLGCLQVKIKRIMI